MVTLRVLDKRTIPDAPPQGARIKQKTWEVAKELVDRIGSNGWTGVKVNASSILFAFRDAQLTMQFREGAVTESFIRGGGLRKEDGLTNPSPGYPRNTTAVVFSSEGLPANSEHNPVLLLNPTQEVEVILRSVQAAKNIVLHFSEGLKFIRLGTQQYRSDGSYNEVDVCVTGPPTEIALTIAGETTIYEIEK
ncbi:MAG: hypothetical protein AB1657_03245 [Candidatus Micrarchaeota archaeon]